MNEISFGETKANRPSNAGPFGGCSDVVEIPLTRGFVTIVDAADAPFVNQWKWCFLASKCRDGKGGYATRGLRIGGRKIAIFLHRELIEAQPGTYVDHRDGDGLNNRRSNLRLATRAQNMQNRRPNRSSVTSLKGVRLRNDGRPLPYLATIAVGGQTVHLGSFVKAEDAARAHDAAARKHFGEFAWINRPDAGPLPPPEPRRCVQCGASIDDRARQARTCSAPCYDRWQIDDFNRRRSEIRGRNKGFSSWLIEAASRAGLSQIELVRRVGVAQQNVSRWYAGDSRPSPAALARLHEVLGAAECPR